ncbi:MAG TPA: 4Fe-4S dicluster domain-containing protein [Bacteroidetes bacterium]|nr:4Fe-4S dicluster domain-containing protein [Bacteroidota bacterium]
MTDNTVDFATSQDFSRVGTLRDAARLSKSLAAGEIGVLFLARTDPVKTLPAELGFAENLQRAKLKVALADLETPTTRACDLILPLSHALESWGDAQPRRGVLSAIQPVMKPIYDTRPEGDILLRFIQLAVGAAPAASFQEYVSRAWRKKYSTRQIDQLLTGGVLVEPQPEARIELRERGVKDFFARFKPAAPAKGPVLVVTPSLRGYDGRSRELPLLQEIPDPLTSISYGEWVSVSEADAGRWGLRDRDEVEVSAGSWKTTIAVKVQKGLPEGVMALQRDLLGTNPLKVAADGATEMSYLDGVKLRKTGHRVALPILAGSMSTHNREIIADFLHGHHGGGEHAQEPAQIYPPHEHKEYRWAMAIDLESCTGCSACVAACTIENNVPLVGPEEHLRGREMFWISIQPYYSEKGEAEFLPMMCQQCGNAPCEAVCPVYATYHNPEGLNAQIYNRCVGTRYCSNNCPYKVRRFNWFDHERPEPLSWMLNPDIFTRGRGVMEKCTFCVHRIRAAKDAAKDENRKVRDGEVIPACAQTCPADAIVFGNILDPTSKVAQLAASGRSYRVLEELNTQPAVNYLRHRSASQSEDTEELHRT